VREMELKYDRGSDDWYPPNDAFAGYICGDGLAKFFHVPSGTRRIWLCWSETPIRGAYKVTRPNTACINIESPRDGGTYQTMIDYLLWDTVLPLHMGGAPIWCWIEYRSPRVS
jgi:hypothetical protein